MRSEKDIKKDYHLLLRSGFFWEFHYDLTGSWDLDREKFISRERALNEEFPQRNKGKK